jgi:hypothetical protein
MRNIKYPIPKKLSNPITSEEEKKKSKYGNKKVVIDGIKFDSQKEGNRYIELKQKERLGLIFDLKLQVKYELQPSYKLNGKTIRSINYLADFVYRETIKNEEGTRELKYKTIVEDTKGYRTDVYKLKKKLFEYKYGIEIEEV